MSGNGRKALPDVRKWSGVSPGCLEVVRRDSRKSKSDREALLDVQEWSGRPLGCLGRTSGYP